MTRLTALLGLLALGCWTPVVDAPGAGGAEACGGGAAGGSGAAGGFGAGAAGGVEDLDAGGTSGGGTGTAGGVGQGGSIECPSTDAWDGGDPEVSVPFSAAVGAQVNDFDFTRVGCQVELTWVAGGALWSHAVTAPGSAEVRLADLPSNYAAIVRGAGEGPDGLGLIVGAGTSSIIARPIDAAGLAGSAVTVATTTVGPPFVGVAWAADTALIAWDGYSSFSFRRMRRGGAFLDASPTLVAFPPSTFVPRVAVASDGTDWLVAVGSTSSALYRVTAAGAVSNVASLGGYVATVSLAHTARGYVLVTPQPAWSETQIELYSGTGTRLAGPYVLPNPTPGQQGIVITDLACDDRQCFVVQARPARVDGFLLDLGGVPQGTFIPIAAMPNVGEVCAVAPEGDGKWWVAYGSWTSGQQDPYFAPLYVRRVRVAP